MTDCLFNIVGLSTVKLVCVTTVTGQAPCSSRVGCGTSVGGSPEGAEARGSPSTYYPSTPDWAPLSLYPTDRSGGTDRLVGVVMVSGKGHGKGQGTRRLIFPAMWVQDEKASVLRVAAPGCSWVVSASFPEHWLPSATKISDCRRRAVRKN